MPKLNVGDEIRLRYGPYQTTGIVTRVIEAGAVVVPAHTATFVGFEKTITAPNGQQLTANDAEDFVGRAHWASAEVVR